MGTLHFGEPPQLEGRCSKDCCSKLHRSETHITREGGLPSRASFPLWVKLRRTHGEHILSGLARTADGRAATNPILPNKPRSVRRLNDREAANEMLRICNDWLKEFCRHYAERQIGPMATSTMR
jgi:hypothetical protein